MTSESKGTVIVTGASGAIGRAIVAQLAEDGYDIAVNDLPRCQNSLESLADDIKKKGRKAIVVVGDVTVEDDVKKLVETTVEKLGGLDVMIANAGIYTGGPFLKTTVNDFDKIFAVNVRGTYLCLRYAAEQMIKQGRGGRIVAASSVAGMTGEPFVTLYGATKWAIRGLITSVGTHVIVPPSAISA
ncbi:hypothetical protein AX15_006588 [Amanita polypyramis BW_CC]|nr:hypothetical protein AX15_006588 [Amanita polypyramis BW_CC]